MSQDQLRIELKAHLVRLMVLSAAAIAAAAPLPLPGDWGVGFRTMLAGWSMVNLVIAGAGFLSKKPLDLRSFREFLNLNLGLNLGYMGTGAAMAFLGKPFVAGMGAAVVFHGLALLVLDGILLARLPKGQEVN